MSIVIIIIIVFIALMILGVITQSKNKRDEQNKANARIRLENAEYMSVKNKQKIIISDSNSNELLTIYPIFLEIYRVNDDDTVYALKENDYRHYILVKDFKTEFEEAEKEYGRITYAHLYFSKASSKTINSNSFDDYHVDEIVDYLDDGWYLIQRSDYSKSNNIKFYTCINDENDRFEIDYSISILVQTENGRKNYRILSTHCLTQDCSV